MAKQSIRDLHKIQTLASSLRLPLKLRFDIVKFSFSDNDELLYPDVVKTLDKIDSFDNSVLAPKPTGFWCRSGYASFWINWKGDMTSCGMIETPIVRNVGTEPFVNAWEKLISQSCSVSLSTECFTCKYRNICSPCAASMQAETGEFGGTPSYRCELMQEYEKILREYVASYASNQECSHSKL